MQQFRIPPEKQPLINQLKETIENKGLNYSFSDSLLLRYLFVTKYDINKTLNKLALLQSWRIEKDIEHILQNDSIKRIHEIVSERLQFVHHLSDRYGRPCTWFRIGQVNLRRLLKDFRKEDIVAAHIYYNEYIDKLCNEESVRQGVDFVGNTTIMDMEGLALSTHMSVQAISLFSEILLIHTYYYPESCDVIYVINAPAVFSFFWTHISKLVSEYQQTKMKVLKSPNNLLMYFSPQDLPPMYGGNCNCEKCRRVEGNQIHEFVATDYKTLQIDKGRCEIVSVRVNPNDNVCWFFSSIVGCIRFSLELETDNGEKVVIVPCIESDPSSSVMSDLVNTTEGGNLIMEFDNSDGTHDMCEVIYEISLNTEK